MTVLCEYFSNLGNILVEQHLLTEASAALSLPIVQSRTGADAAIRAAHNDEEIKLGHDVEFLPSRNVSGMPLMDIFGSGKEVGWLLLFGVNGTAVLRVSTPNVPGYRSKALKYQAIVADAQNKIHRSKPTSIKKDILDAIRALIGKVTDVYLGIQPVRKTASARKDIRAQRDIDPMSQYSSKEQWFRDFGRLVTKFKPLWAKLVQKALAEIKSHIITGIKSDRMTNLNYYTNRYQLLINAYRDLQDPKSEWSSSTTLLINNAVKRGLAMTAAYFYPEETGQINVYGVPERTTGIFKILKDFDEGDQTKLATMLYFVKDAIMTSRAHEKTNFGIYPDSYSDNKET